MRVFGSQDGVILALECVRKLSCEVVEWANSRVTDRSVKVCACVMVKNSKSSCGLQKLYL